MASMMVIAQTNGMELQAVKNIRSFEKRTGMHLTLEHGGKMKGTPSLSTICRDNPFCLARMQDGNNICAHCFADAMYNTETGLYRHTHCFDDNYDLLQNHGDEIEVMDLTGVPFFRGESFGDSATWKHPCYYIRLAKANKGTQIALWTKNPWFVRQALKKMGLKRKPSNLQVIYSSLKLNECDMAMALRYSDVVDKIFTVYTPEFLAEHPEIKINCGAKNCKNHCGYRCYKRSHSKGIVVINERLKSRT